MLRPSCICFPDANKMLIFSIPLDSVSCSQARVPLSSEQGQNVRTNSLLSASVLHGSSSKAVVSLDFEPEVFMGRKETDQEESKDSSHMVDKESGPDVRRPPQSKEDSNVGEKERSDKEQEETGLRSREPASSPHFCSKHQRWVKSILQECPDECSEELLLQATVSSSPLLFQSSSSTSSSQDLTPSNLILCPPGQQHPSSQTAAENETPAKASEQANSEDKRSPGSADSASQMDPLPPPSLCRESLPALWSPVIRLVDIASVRRSCPTIKPHQSSPTDKKAASSTSSPQMLLSPLCQTSGNKDSTFSQQQCVDSLNSVYKLQAAPDFTSSQSTQRPFSRLSRRYRRACSTRHSQTLGGFSQDYSAEQEPAAVQISCLSLPNLVAGPSTYHASTSTNQPGTLSSVCSANKVPPSAKSSRQVVHQDPIDRHIQTHNTSRLGSRSTVASSASNSDCQAENLDTRRPQRRPSPPSQAAFAQPTLLQPCVSLTRLSAQDCYQMTKGRCSSRRVDPVSKNDEQRRKEEEDADSSFDPNTLYSSHSSGSDTEDTADHDPDYKPWIKKKSLLLEYEAARTLNHT